MRSPGTSLSFALLQERLIEQIRLRLFNGEMTERRLARIVGLSQPHVHNVLKGVRAMTPEVADLLLGGLGLSALDLIETREAGALIEGRQYESDRSMLAPVVEGLIGPGHAFPRLAGGIEWVRLPAAVWAGRRRMVLAPLARDAESPLPGDHDFGLICLDEEARLRVSPRDVAVLRWRGAGYLRRVRSSGASLRIVRQQNWLAPDALEQIALEGQSLLSAVRGVVLWSGPDFRGLSPLDYMGSFLEKPASR